MRHIVFTWEWGAGAGHLRRIAPVAERLVEQGHEVTVISRDVTRTWGLFRQGQVRCLPCPVAEAPSRRCIRNPVTFAQIAWNLGFDREERVTSHFRVWRDLFELLEAEVVISDFGLASVAVARALGLETIRIGNGYLCPPNVDPPPKFDFALNGDTARKWPPESEPAGDPERCARRVLETIHRSLRRVGLPAQPSWGELLVPAERSLLITLPPLDPYRGQRSGGDYVGLWDRCGGCQPEWPAFGDSRAFAYLKSFRSLPRLLAELTAARVGTALVCDGVPDSQKPPPMNLWVRVQKSLIDVSQTEGQCRFAVCNANHGVTAHLLTLGVPILAVPLYLEQRITAEAVERAGCGIAVPPNQPDRFRGAIDRLVHDRSLAGAARKFAQRYSHYGDGGLGRALDQLDAILGSVTGRGR